MRYLLGLLATAFIAFPACAAPRIDNVVVKPNPAKFAGSTPPEVEVAVTVVRGKFDSGGGCEVSVDPGDGSRARTLEFGTQEKVTRTTRFTYKQNGSFKLRVQGRGKTPCAGEREIAVAVSGAPEAKKAAEKKKAEKKKAEKKKAATKKSETKQ